MLRSARVGRLVVIALHREGEGYWLSDTVRVHLPNQPSHPSLCTHSVCPPLTLRLPCLLLHAYHSPQVWLELDGIIRAVTAIQRANGYVDNDSMPLPLQLLGLMPPPPQHGWPGSFALQVTTLSTCRV